MALGHRFRTDPIQSRPSDKAGAKERVLRFLMRILTPEYGAKGAQGRRLATRFGPVRSDANTVAPATGYAGHLTHEQTIRDEEELELNPYNGRPESESPWR